MRAFLALSIYLLTLGAAVAQGPPAALVDVDAVIREPMTQTQRVVGQLVALDSSVIAARVDGPIQQVTVRVGDAVNEGDLLARLDTDRLQAALDVTAAELEERRARVESAAATEALYSQDMQRLERLRGSAAFNQARYDDAIAELNRAIADEAEAQAGMRRAEVSRDLTELELGWGSIRAPFPGVVSTRHVDVGEYVRIGDPIVTLVNHRDLEVDVAVPAGSVGGLAPGREVRVTLTEGVDISATVRALVPVEDPLTRTRIVRLTPEIDYDAANVAARQSVVVHVPVAEALEVVSVHKDAVISGPTGRIVYVVEDGQARPRPIEIGAAIGNRFEVIGGLDVGETVVIRGNEGLTPGSAVQARGS